MCSDTLKLPLRKAHLWGNCSGYSKAVSGRTAYESDTEKAEKAVIWLAGESLFSPVSEYIGASAPNGVTVDHEIAECASVLIAEMQPHIQESSVILRSPVNPWPIHDSVYGEVPFHTITEDGELVVRVWDYIHGHSIPTARGNPKLVGFAMGLIDGIEGNIRSMKFVLTTVAPRAFHSPSQATRWEAGIVELMGYASKLREVVTNPDTPLSTGAWCRSCPAMATCSAARQKAYATLDFVDAAYEIDEMSDEDIGAEYRLLSQAKKFLDSRVDAIKVMLEHKIDGGSVETGYRKEDGGHVWKWEMKDEQVISAMALFGVDIEKKSLLTVAQTRALLPAKQRPQFDEFRARSAVQKAKKPRLVPIDETKAAAVFGRKT